MTTFHGILMLLIASFELFWGLYIFIKDSKNQVKLWIFLFTASIFLWVGSLGLDLLVNTKRAVEIVGYLPWLGGICAVSSLLFITWIWPFKLRRITWVNWLVIIFPIVVFSILIFSPLAPVVQKTQLDEWRSNPGGPSYIFYNFFILIYIIWAIVNLIISYNRSDGILRWQTKYFAVGIGITGLITMTTNVIIPWLGVNYAEFIQSAIGPEASIIWIGFTLFILFKKRIN